MFRRQTSGSVVCRSCAQLVGVNDETCYHCGARNPGLWGYAPLLRALGDDLGFVHLVTFGCILLYLATLAVDPQGIRNQGFLSLMAPSLESLFRFGASGSVPVFFYGRWWTLLSAGWLHGGILHIALNLYWVRQLAPVTAEIYGPGRMVLIYAAGSILGFGASSAAGLVLGPVPFIGGAVFTIGASAPIFGLLGALVYSGQRGGSSFVSNQAKSLAIVFFVLGFALPGIDNWAHAGGFAGGYLLARWLDPMLPERINHLAGAAVCIGLTALAILASLLQGLR